MTASVRTLLPQYGREGLRLRVFDDGALKAKFPSDDVRKWVAYNRAEVIVIVAELNRQLREALLILDDVACKADGYRPLLNVVGYYREQLTRLRDTFDPLADDAAKWASKFAERNEPDGPPNHPPTCPALSPR